MKNFFTKFWELLSKLITETSNSQMYWSEFAYPYPGSFMKTTLKVRNDSTSPVVVYITLGATPGCVQDVIQIAGARITKLYPLMGHFNLAVGEVVTLSVPDDLGFNGNFSFNTPPMNCPTPEFPDGVNLAEFIINNGFQGQYAQETIDISCVAGANCLMQMEMDTSDWTTNGGKVKVNSIENGPKLNNTNRMGVFPYGCDNCTSSDNPPSCVGQQPQYANKEPICNVQRSALSNDGGTLTIVYKGSL